MKTNVFGKWIMLLMLGVALCAGWSSCSDDDNDNPDEQITKEELPKVSQDFLSTYFSGSKITRVDREGDYDGSAYEVKFADGGEVEFDAAGEWISVESGPGKSVPDALIPQQIKDYVTKNFAGTQVKDISRNLYGWEIELSNDLDIHFTNDFTPVVIDR